MKFARLYLICPKVAKKMTTNIYIATLSSRRSSLRRSLNASSGEAITSEIRTTKHKTLVQKLYEKIFKKKAYEDQKDAMR